MLARHEWANSASGAVPVVLIRGGITKADFKTAAALQQLGDEGDDWCDEGRLIRCTVPGLTPNLAAILRTPGLPGVARASRICFGPPEAFCGLESLFLARHGLFLSHRQKSLNRASTVVIHAAGIYEYTALRPCTH